MKATIEYLLDGKGLVEVTGEIEVLASVNFSVTDDEAFAFLNPAPTTYEDVLRAATTGIAFSNPLTFEEALAELLAGVEATKAIEASHQGLVAEAAKKLEPELRKKAENWKLRTE